MISKYTSRKSKINLETLVFLVLVAYFLLSTIMPFVSQVIDAYFYLGAVLLIYFGVFFRNYKSFNDHFLFLLPFLGIVFIELIYALLYQDKIFIFAYDQLLQLLPPVLCFFLLSRNQRKNINWILFIAIAAFLITAMTSYIGLKNDMSAARWLATVSDSKDLYFISLNLKNIGGYTTVYSVVLLFPMLICLYKQKRIKGYLFCIIAVTLCLYLIRAQYTIALILFFCSSVLLFFPKKLNKKMIKIFIFSVIIILIIGPLLGKFLYFLSENTKSIEVSERLYVVGDMLNGVKNTTYANTRQHLILYDLNIFLKNPLFGSLFFGSGENSGHSFLLDIFAKFGIMGGVALFFMYRQIFKKFYLPFRETSYYGYMLWAFFQTLFLSSMNTGAWLFIIAFMVPLIGYILQDKQYISTPKGAVLIENIMD